MSLNSVSFWTRCWRTVFGGTSSNHVTAAALPVAMGPITTPKPQATQAAAVATVIELVPDASLPAAEAGVQATAFVDATPILVSAEILVLPSDAARHYMLAARLGSVRALNQPKSRIRKPAGPTCTTKPLPKRYSAAAPASALKPHRHCASPRVLRPVSTSATIIQLAQRRPQSPAQSAALKRTA